MLAGSLSRRFAYASSAPSGRVAGAILAALFFLLLPATAQEPAGGAAAPAPGRLNAGRRAGPRVVTNEDLKPMRLRREAQEAEHERTHRERGMPSRQELEQYFEEQDRKLHESALRFEEERAKAAELESVRSELADVKRTLYELSLRLSQQTGDYRPAHVYPNYYPYYYAPPAQFITLSPFGRRGGFGLHPRGRTWSYNPWHGRPSPPLRGAPLYRGAPATPAPRR
jgi:hypothetical protein